MHLTKKLNQKGIGLIETLIALSISIIIVTAMVSLAVFTLRASTQNKLLLTGSQLANQEIELARAYRDTNTWADFIAAIDGSGASCFFNDCYMNNSGTLSVQSGTTTIGSGNETITKGFRLTDINGDMSLIRIAVTVSWQLGAETKYAHNYTELSNWRSQ